MTDYRKVAHVHIANTINLRAVTCETNMLVLPK